MNPQGATGFDGEPPFEEVKDAHKLYPTPPSAVCPDRRFTLNYCCTYGDETLFSPSFPSSSADTTAEAGLAYPQPIAGYGYDRKCQAPVRPSCRLWPGAEQTSYTHSGRKQNVKDSSIPSEPIAPFPYCWAPPEYDSAADGSHVEAPASITASSGAVMSWSHQLSNVGTMGNMPSCHAGISQVRSGKHATSAFEYKRESDQADGQTDNYNFFEQQVEADKSLKAHRPYLCTQCGKGFIQKGSLKAHGRTHSGEKPFSCPICQRLFTQTSSLMTHKRTHTGEKPYRCIYCVKAFSDNSTLTKHMRTHTGQKPYQCTLCTMKFTQSGNLSRHMKTHQNNMTRM